MMSGSVGSGVGVAVWKCAMVGTGVCGTEVVVTTCGDGVAGGVVGAQAAARISRMRTVTLRRLIGCFFNTMRCSKHLPKGGCYHSAMREGWSSANLTPQSPLHNVE